MQPRYAAHTDHLGNYYLSLPMLAQLEPPDLHWRAVWRMRNNPYNAVSLPDGPLEAREWYEEGERIAFQFSPARWLIGLCAGHIDVVPAGNFAALQFTEMQLQTAQWPGSGPTDRARMEQLCHFLLRELWWHDVVCTDAAAALEAIPLSREPATVTQPPPLNLLVPQLHDYILWFQYTTRRYRKFCYHPGKETFIEHAVE